MNYHIGQQHHVDHKLKHMTIFIQKIIQTYISDYIWRPDPAQQTTPPKSRFLF